MDSRITEENKIAVLLATHFVNDTIYAKYKRLKDELNEGYDVYLLVNSDELKTDDILKDVRNFISDCDSLNNLGYTPIEETMVPGSSHFPVLRFYLNHPNYGFYWLIEYDVEFTGTWNCLMGDVDGNLTQYDFVASHLEKFSVSRNQKWSWWERNNNVGVPLDQCLKAFHPICRYSNRALKYIDEYQKKGHSAHSEVIIPTCLYHKGYRLGDFGGLGEFVPHGYENKYYWDNILDVNDGSIRYRPLFTADEIRKDQIANRIYHPLK